MSGFYQGSDPDVITNAEGWAKQAQDWAIKLDGPVSGSDYSAQYNAEAAQVSANSAAQSAQEAEAAKDRCEEILAELEAMNP